MTTTGERQRTHGDHRADMPWVERREQTAHIRIFIEGEVRINAPVREGSDKDKVRRAHPIKVLTVWRRLGSWEPSHNRWGLQYGCRGRVQLEPL